MVLFSINDEFIYVRRIKNLSPAHSEFGHPVRRLRRKLPTDHSSVLGV